jgi:DNA-binding transcriptional LysR family regulator
LGARLLNRSTRKLRLTPEGEAFYDQTVRILRAIADAEREAGADAMPRGHIRVNSNVPVGIRLVIPILQQFLEERPEITLDVVLSDTIVDLMDERADVAIRVGPLRDSTLMARKLGTSKMAVVGSPAYLARSGHPAATTDLANYKGIGWGFSRSIAGWPFKVNGGVEAITPPSVISVSDGESARLLALNGVGLVRLAMFHIREDVDAGRLVPVLQDLNPGDQEDIHAVFLGQKGLLPARVRAFIDFLARRIDTEHS